MQGGVIARGGCHFCMSLWSRGRAVNIYREDLCFNDKQSPYLKTAFYNLDKLSFFFNQSQQKLLLESITRLPNSRPAIERVPLSVHEHFPFCFQMGFLGECMVQFLDLGLTILTGLSKTTCTNVADASHEDFFQSR